MSQTESPETASEDMVSTPLPRTELTSTPVPRGHFFLPGPTEVHPYVLEAQAEAMIAHRGQGMRDLMAELQEGLRGVFMTSRDVFVSTSSATGLMEAAVRNGSRGRVLALVNGGFSERFARITAACGIEMDVLEVSWGATHEPEVVHDALVAGVYDAVSVVHSETSTGALQDLPALSEVVAEFDDTLLLVDSVTGVGGAELRADEWGLDFVLTGSQKALALPPGLSFAVASEAMMDRSATAERKGVYFDLETFAKNMAELQTPTTPALSLLYALRAQLVRIRAETIEGRWRRHLEMARMCWQWVERLRSESGVTVEVLASEGGRSPTVTCVRLPFGVSGPSVVEAVRARGWVIGGGYGKLKEAAIRIGHMGDHTPSEQKELLEVLGEVLTG